MNAVANERSWSLSRDMVLRRLRTPSSALRDLVAESSHDSSGPRSNESDDGSAPRSADQTASDEGTPSAGPALSLEGLGPSEPSAKSSARPSGDSFREPSKEPTSGLDATDCTTMSEAKDSEWPPPPSGPRDAGDPEDHTIEHADPKASHGRSNDANHSGEGKPIGSGATGDVIQPMLNTDQERFLELLCDRLSSSTALTKDQIESVRKVYREIAQDNKDLHWSVSGILPGAKLGEYEIQEMIGEGGSGQVYAAVHADGHQPVAIKILHQTKSTKRFRREMDLVTCLAHPNIVVAYEVGESNGHLYIVMERLKGPDMRAKVRNEGPLAWQHTVPIILQAASALDQAHERSLIHRDIKPGNLILSHDGAIKVADLGLAMSTADVDSDNPDYSQITRVESLGGTPGYMAPEQAHSLSLADQRSDIYSLGATWFFLLTGTAMVPGSTWNDRLTALIENRGIRDLPSGLLPESLEGLWRQMVERNPERRPQSMDEVIKSIQLDSESSDTDIRERIIEVLVVEDDQDDLYITIESLRRFNRNVKVHSASSLASAIEVARQNSIDVTLLDLQLTDSTGISTVDRFHQAHPNAPVIVLSGNSTADIAEDCRRRGADEFVLKHSLDVHEMERLIFVTLSRHDSRRNPSGSRR